MTLKNKYMRKSYGIIVGMKVRDLIRQLERDGWYHVKTRGSHRQFKHPIKKGKVTISGALNQDIPIGTLRNILRQAQGDE